MDQIVAVFPGQGSQRRGMGLDFAERFAESRLILEEASDALSLDVAAICADDGDPRLDLTEFTQPCILAAEIAMLAALRERFGFAPSRFGGHSLGEYTALVAAGAIPFETAVRLVRLRGKLMQEAVALGKGAMAAVIMEELPHHEIAVIAEDLEVDLANDNSSSQVVLSGTTDRVARACAAFEEIYAESGIRVVPLAVSAPFHSRHMACIEGEFSALLREESGGFAPAAARAVTSNLTGGFHSGSLDELIAALSGQISGRVRWRDNMAALGDGSPAIFEIGPGRPLTAFFKTMNLAVKSIVDVRTAERAFGQRVEQRSGVDVDLRVQ